MSETMVVEASRRFGTVSPLRYPGGKAALAGLFADLISDLGLREPCYVEPYAGGVGAGIALLRQDLIDHLVVNDIDPAVHAFWFSVVKHNAEFVDRVGTVPLTIDEWHRQRSIYRLGDATDPMALGFAFFYLNRTNRSGVLNAGVIGGQAQTGNYLIDARFNRSTLANRLTEIGERSHRITVSDLDGRTVIGRYSDDPCVFMYIDPPYVQAGSQLYLNAFDGRDHNALCRMIDSIGSAHWLLTYDAVPRVELLYNHHFHCKLKLNYSARHHGKAEELLVASPRVANALRRITMLATTGPRAAAESQG